MAAGVAQFIIGKRTKMTEHTEKVRRLLFDDGPQTILQLSEALDVSMYWMSDILSYMRTEGIVEIMRRDGTVYWILYEDALA